MLPFVFKKKERGQEEHIYVFMYLYMLYGQMEGYLRNW